jgi:hypothetical protein
MTPVAQSAGADKEPTLVGSGANSKAGEIQMREGRWVIADLRHKDGRIRIVAIPVWEKKGIDVWRSAAGLGQGRLLTSIRKGGRIGEGLSDLGDLVGGRAGGQADLHRALRRP